MYELELWDLDFCFYPEEGKRRKKARFVSITDAQPNNPN